jgi:hypothetical protein
MIKKTTVCFKHFNFKHNKALQLKFFHVKTSIARQLKILFSNFNLFLPQNMSLKPTPKHAISLFSFPSQLKVIIWQFTRCLSILLTFKHFKYRTSKLDVRKSAN